MITNILKTKLSLLSIMIAGALQIAYAQSDMSSSNDETLEEVTVSDKAIERDPKGKDEVYDRDMSTTFASFEEVQRYKGTTPSDIFNGMPGVASSDARNGGAIDPNVRGIQGEGRVPVIIDGTEQAVTVWRGYNGANNRNYIDPMLIGSVQVEKGPSMTRGVHSSVGGAVLINTLEANDIIPEGKDSGVNIMIEANNNSVSPRLPNLQNGVNIFDIPGNDPFKMTAEEFEQFIEDNDINYFGGLPSYNTMFQHIDPETLKKPYTSGQNKFGNDYAFRLAAAKRWDDFELTGAIVQRKRGNYFAGQNGWESYYQEGDIDVTEYNRVAALANLYSAGSEVLNSSNETRSVLGKIKWQPNDEHTFKLGVKHSNSKFGDIFPTRLESFILETQGKGRNEKLFPTDKLPQWNLGKAKTSALTLDWDFDSANPLVDVKASIWATYNDLDTNTSGASPRSVYALSHYLVDPQGQLQNSDCLDVPPQMHNTPMYIMQCKGILEYAKFQKQQQYDNLSSEQQKKLDNFLKASKPIIAKANTTEAISSLTNSKETRIGFDISNKMEIKPNLDVTLGLAYQYARLRSDDNWWVDKEYEEYTKIGTEYLTSAGIFLPPIEVFGVKNGWFMRAHPREGTRHYAEANVNTNWRPSDRLMLNAGLKFNYYNSIDEHTAKLTNKKQKKWQDTGWAPVLSGAYSLTDDTRIYARMAQAVRHPSLFESTKGFSMASTKQNFEQLKSEKSTNFELGLVQDFSSILPGAQFADLKLSYYHNTIRDAFERDESFDFANVDKQISSGIELQGRYDNGRFFTDISATYALKNQVCDAEMAKTMRDIDWAKTNLDGNCAEGGFPNGYLQNTVPPKYTWGIGVGMRFFDNKLTLGSRVNYHSKPRNNTVFEANLNNTIYWDSATILDAYVKYQEKDWSAELTGTNLTNRYYLDRYNRTMVPAPGRTVKLTFNKTF